ncbi:MAG: putative bifunctional diguanylate cyclase/phosphodiesterase [Thermosynechococcaceae cyanobacterium]
MQTQSIFSGLFERLDTVILAQQLDQSFLIVGKVPGWFCDFCPQREGSHIRVEDVFPFLSSFMADAQAHWQNQQTDILESELWVEASPDGQEIPLGASAVLLNTLQLLLIRQEQTVYREQGSLLQKGREAALESQQERKMTAAQLQYSTFYDCLTGLPNQTFLRVQLVQALERLRQEQVSLFTLCLLSVNDFKVVSRRYGQAFSDQLLMQVIERLRHHLELEDLLVRLGENNFVFIPWSLNTRQRVEALTEAMLQELALPYQLGPHEVSSSFSLGLSQGTAFQDQPEDILDHARMAMGYAKHQGEPYRFFDSTLHLEVIRNSDLERDLPQSIHQQQLLAYYEPVVSLQHRKVTGFEALVRWNHPTYGLIFPGDFIPLAEKTGFVVPLGKWMLEQACTQVAQWNNGSNHDLAVQVNLSARQLAASNLLETVQTILEQTPVLPQYLKLEITESMVHEDLDSSIQQLEYIRAFGVRICLDDFGTGYSSLNYLHRLPLDTLKIDRSLTQATSPGSTEILTATINLAHNLSLDVIAEGVETPQQLHRLQRLGCDYAQGYLFAKAQPPDLAQAFLDQPLTVLQATDE